MIPCSAIALLLVAAPAVEPQVLNTRLPVWDTLVIDVNGDGLDDVAAFCADDKSYPLEKDLTVFLASAPGKFLEQASVELALDPAVGTAFFAELDGSAPKEFVAVDSNGASAYRFREDRWETLGHAEFPSLWPTGVREPVFLRDTAYDLNGDGLDEWLAPTPSGYEVRNMIGVVASVPCDVVSAIRTGSSTYITHRLPAYQLFDLPGSDTKALAFLSDEFADFAFGANWAERRRHRIPVQVGDKWDAQVRMEDLNADGFPDLIIAQTEGMVNMRSLTQVYLAKGPFTYPDAPTAAFETRGALTSPVAIDINGDKRLDLVFVNIPLNVRSFFNYFVRGKLTISADVHLYRDGSYPPKPSFRTTLTLDAPDGRQSVAYTMGDYTGDGYVDAAFGRSIAELGIYEGKPNDFLASRPILTFPLPSFGVARSHDIDANGRDDIIIHHPASEHSRRIEIIVF